MIDSITQYILNEDVKETAKRAASATGSAAKQVGTAVSRQALNKTAKTSTYVANKLRSKFPGKVTDDKCLELHNTQLKYGRGQGQCNAAKSEYYRHLTHICKDGFKLQGVLDQMNKRFRTPKGLRDEAMRLKERIMASKEELSNAKIVIDEKCREEMERSVKDKAEQKRKALKATKKR